MSFRELIIGCLLALIMVIPAQGFQTEQSDTTLRQQVGLWADVQQREIAQFGEIQLRARVSHAVETQGIDRRADISMSFRGVPDAPGIRPEIEQLILNGDTLDTSQASRVQKSMAGIMTREMGPLLFGFRLPALEYRRLQLVEPPVMEALDGQDYVRFEFQTRQERPDQNAVSRRPVGGRPSPGMRPPRGMRPPVARNLPEQRSAPEQIIMWFEKDMSSLSMSAITIELPGKRSVQVVTEYSRIREIDVPVFRTISGTVPLQRRLRTVTANLDNETTYSDYVFR